MGGFSVKNLPGYDPRGTSKSLTQALIRGLEDLGLHETRTAPLEERLQEFMSQKFGKAMITENQEVADAIKKLWESIIEPKSESLNESLSKVNEGSKF